MGRRETRGDEVAQAALLGAEQYNDDDND